MKKTLILYSSTDGHTLRICEHIKSNIENHTSVLLKNVEETSNLDLGEFDCVVLGASIRYGNHKPSLYAFVKKNEGLLNAKKTAFFNVNAVARKEDKNSIETNPYLKKFLKKVSWQPDMLAVFAGKISYPDYHFFDKHMIRFIMWMSKGPTDQTKVFEFTDWDKVNVFSEKICKEFLPD
ncbi:MAG: menaquinone-dependent protoporphyrinogen IX dehydrogenase [Gammaproteobacteria bacterium]|tara:strand:- start:13321 stop:13857 length:537 start_codon:yes stop_codon:yes gene_type:complete